MKVLVVGGGAREHALAWKLKQSSHVSEIICAPGNPGISSIATCIDTPASSIERLADLAVVQGIDLTIASAEASIGKGIVDYFKERRLRIVGPTQSTTNILGSHYSTKEFLLKNKIPTARYAAFEREDLALAYVNSLKCPLVVRSSTFDCFDRITIAESSKQAHTAIKELFAIKNQKVGVVIEDCLTGQEMSLEILSDGLNAVVMVPVCTQKRLYDDDKGPVTSGMGAYADTNIIDEDRLSSAVADIIDPLFKAFCKTGSPFVGALHISICFDDKDKARILSLKPTLADIETQVLMPLFNEDLFEIYWNITEGNLAHFADNGFSFHPLSCLAIAFNSLPGHVYSFNEGNTEALSHLRDGRLLLIERQVVDSAKPVTISARPLIFYDCASDSAEQHVISSKIEESRQATHRIMTLALLADNLLDCKIAAYDLAKQIKFEGMHFRKDIGD